MARDPKDFVGKKFGKLEIVSFSRKDNNSNNYYLCKCDCGTEKVVAQNHLVSGKTKSCGCLKQHPSRRVMNIQEQINELRDCIERSLHEVGIGAVYTILEVLNAYLTNSSDSVRYQIIQIK